MDSLYPGEKKGGVSIADRRKVEDLPSLEVFVRDSVTTLHEP